MDDEEMGGGSGDSVMDAIEMLKDKMLAYMVSKGESPEAEAGEPPAMEASEHEMPPEDDISEIETESAKPPSVFSRVGDGPPMPPKKPRKRKPTF